MDERKLDRALEAWGQAPLGSEDAVARILAEAERVSVTPAAVTPVRRWWAWGAGGSVAAALAMALLWGQPMASPAPGEDPVVMASVDPSASFAMLYSTTTEEEMLL